MKKFLILTALLNGFSFISTTTWADHNQRPEHVVKRWTVAELVCDFSQYPSEENANACTEQLKVFALGVAEKYLAEQKALNLAAPLTLQGLIDTHGFGLNLRGALGLPISERAYQIVYEYLLAHQVEFDTEMLPKRNAAFAEVKKILTSSADQANGDLRTKCDEYLAEVAPSSMNIAGQLVDFCATIDQ